MQSNETQISSAPWRRIRRLVLAVAVFATLIAAFYAEENWRGKRAWEHCQRELEAHGEVLDWSAYIPEPVPDEQNIFKAPKMAEWFVRDGGGELTKRLNLDQLTKFVQDRGSNALIELTVLPGGSRVQTNAADLLLRFEDSLWSLAAPEDFAVPPPESIPLIQFEAVPLTTAIENLARQASIHYVLDPQILSRWQTYAGAREPEVTIRWENLTARQAFQALLHAYGLALIADPNTGIGRVVARDSAQSQMVIAAEARLELNRLIREAEGRDERSNAAPVLSLVRNMRFVTGDVPIAKPVRVLVLSEDLPDARAVQDMFPRAVAGWRDGRSGWRAAGTAENIFRLFPLEEQVCSARDYVAWSDQFAPEFAIIRSALQRPLARLGGDFQRPFSLPIPDFVCLRNLAQTLAERAQCHLLLGQPEQALADLTLMHDLHRLLAGKPTLLVAAMIDVAITGLYTSIIADGLALRAWREPELIALQQQLAEVNLAPSVMDSLRTERAASCQTLLHLKPDELVELFDFEKKRTHFWAKITYPPYLLMKVAPRGWAYQNLATVAQLKPGPIFGISNIIGPSVLRRATEASLKMEETLKHWSPFTILARIAVPNYSRALQTTARNQTFANEAFVVCGLERYYLAHGEYPEALDVLTPEFVASLPLDLIGGAPLKFRRLDDGQFLLYSVGWNETDDGGQVASNGWAVDNSAGDWVWQTPLK